ncbi:hypothetical protein CRE_24716 [Caenorhabditis remanei]|uniref:Uncharacterized protein n=1 Tax=Caenorhabditis remanei TaxID=31234 RepID=E3N3Z2_CAERE|nr:hypothetical protein CRE_24716 [Caenorhabditis remanei]
MYILCFWLYVRRSALGKSDRGKERGKEGKEELGGALRGYAQHVSSRWAREKAEKYLEMESVLLKNGEKRKRDGERIRGAEEDNRHVWSERE